MINSLVRVTKTKEFPFTAFRPLLQGF